MNVRDKALTLFAFVSEIAIASGGSSPAFSQVHSRDTDVLSTSALETSPLLVSERQSFSPPPGSDEHSSPSTILDISCVIGPLIFAVDSSEADSSLKLGLFSDKKDKHESTVLFPPIG